ncbi:hypothetical protein ACHAWF_017610, partial [Thalassiosira exigua]
PWSGSRRGGCGSATVPSAGGTAHAAKGKLTIMASGPPDALEYVDLLLRLMESEVRAIPRGVRMVSEVKAVRQLLAGAHTVAAAEVLALASKAGLDVEQVYDVVNGTTEAKRLGCPVPLALAALQQFDGGKGRGLKGVDDSQVVKVYEALAGVLEGKPPKGEDVGKYWTFPDVTRQRILEVSDEARHDVDLSNEYARVMKVAFPPGDATHAH